MARFLSSIFYFTLSNLPLLFHAFFLRPSGGKMNFMGTKRWLDYQLDENVESDLSSNVKYVLCLDALGGSEDKENLYLHVSKPPKEGSTGHA